MLPMQESRLSPARDPTRPRLTIVDDRSEPETGIVSVSGALRYPYSILTSHHTLDLRHTHIVHPGPHRCRRRGVQDHPDPIVEPDEWVEVRFLEVPYDLPENGSLGSKPHNDLM
jgi:hypothetical protein